MDKLPILLVIIADTTSRNITNMGLIAWHGVYNALVDSNIIGTGPTVPPSYPHFIFSRDSLEKLYFGAEGGTINASTPGTITFHFYLDTANNLPAIALSNCSSPSDSFLIGISRGRGLFVDSSTLKTGFGNWKKLNNISSGFILVNSYSTCWSKIGKAFSNGYNFLGITILAHTVSPLDSAMYDLPNNNTEGYVVFDIAFGYYVKNPTDQKINGASLSIYTDFVAPCPKNCYSN